MIKKVTITPKFIAHEVWMDTMGFAERQFQVEALALGYKLKAYMIDYINSHRHRRQGPKENSQSLAKVIDLEILTTTAGIGWGIGNINKINKIAPHWYVLNYGKTVSGVPFVPGGGKTIHGYFSPSGRPDATKSGGKEPFIYGTGSAMTPKKAIRSIPYIDATHFRLNIEAYKLFRAFAGK